MRGIGGPRGGGGEVGERVRVVGLLILLFFFFDRTFEK